MAMHSFSNHATPPVSEFVSLPDHKPLNRERSIATLMKKDASINIEYVQVRTEDSIMLDAWINKPLDFDPNKRYPVVFYVYGEAGGSTVNDQFGYHNNFLYAGDMRKDGYIQVSIDNRGTPSLKGAGWRKSIYGKNGQLNIRDLAQGAKKLLERSYMDKGRVAVWGWSGGGTSTLHLLFRHPEIFQTGIAIAPVTNLLYYDNIYTERYMGLPEENMQNYIAGSAVTYAKDLKGNLLLIHGTGDDNVHYSNTEALINELVKHGKQFRLMSYPNRTHNISEGAGTFEHLSALYTSFLKEHCAPGAK
jgi:dipeptidyl-peptidase-4